MLRKKTVIRVIGLALTGWDAVERFRLRRWCEQLAKENAALRERQDLIEASLSKSLLKPGYGTGVPVSTAVGELKLRKAGGPYEGRGFLVYLPSNVMLPADAAKMVAAVSDNRLRLTVLPNFAREVCEGAVALILADPDWEREGPFESGLPARSMLRVFGPPQPAE